jgi:hypothetical protein
MNRSTFARHDLHPIEKKEPEICGMDGGAHRFTFTNYIKYVDRGVCDCGAVKFEPNETGEFARRQAEIQNNKHGKPGKVYTGTIHPNISRQIKEEKNMVTGTGERATVTSGGGLSIDLSENQNPITRDNVKAGDLPPIPPSGVMPRTDPGDYTQDEKKLIAAEGKAAGSKSERKRVAEKYHITPVKLHGWNLVYLVNAGKHREFTPARRIALEKNRAVRGKNKNKPAASLPAVPSSPPVERECNTCHGVYPVTELTLGVCQDCIAAEVKNRRLKRRCLEGCLNEKLCILRDDAKFITDDVSAPACDLYKAPEIKPAAPSTAAFPAFSNNWPESVQNTWLHCFTELQKLATARPHQIEFAIDGGSVSRALAVLHAEKEMAEKSVPQNPVTLFFRKLAAGK